MSNIKVYNKNSFLPMKNFESRDLSYSILENIDFTELAHTISFYRSDFRGTQFKNVFFYKNNFDRSDFLNSIFFDCKFEKVNFGCCQIKNCYFENATFKNNLYRNTSIHSTTFVNCIFPDESFLINMQHCQLINCSFTGCNFEMSTTDSDKFERCTFIKTNLATMHAENHTFVECEFDSVYMDSSYFFGYFVTRCNMKNINLLYRGEYLKLNSLSLEKLGTSFKKENRFNDLINLLKYSNRQNEIPIVVKMLIKHYLTFSYGRLLDITTIINTLILSSIYEEIDFNILYEVLNELNEEKWTTYSFSDKNDIASMINKFQNALFLSPHSIEYLTKIDQKQSSLLTLKFKSDDYDVCLNQAKKFINSFSDITYWRLVEKKQGSWLLTFALPTVVLLCILPRIIKNYSDVYYDIKTKKALSKKLMLELNKPNLSAKQMEKLESNINSAQLLMSSGKCINENQIKEIQSIIANI